MELESTGTLRITSDRPERPPGLRSKPVLRSEAPKNPLTKQRGKASHSPLLRVVYSLQTSSAETQKHYILEVFFGMSTEFTSISNPDKFNVRGDIANIKNNSMVALKGTQLKENI